MKEEVCTRCLDMLLKLIILEPKMSKTPFKLVGDSISNYESMGVELPLEYYKRYNKLRDKYEPEWEDNPFYQKGIIKK